MLAALALQKTGNSMKYKKYNFNQFKSFLYGFYLVAVEMIFESAAKSFITFIKKIFKYSAGHIIF
jgi:hypothetical protein